VTLVTVDPFPATALAALCDDGLPAPAPGDPLPPYWHLAACAVPPPAGDIGPDGHPRSGAVTAPEGLPRRMFAGGRLTADGPVRVGERLDRSQQVTAVTDKQGRSGPLRFITVRATFRRPGGGIVLTEEQDLVYRPATPVADAAGSVTRASATAIAPRRPLDRPGGTLRAAFRADAVTLHRFSAATSNTHRIHYDHPYATSVEGYPGLVVHGPLLLLSMLELIRLDLPGRVVTRASFAARAPVFAGDAIELAGQQEPDGTIRLSARPAGAAGAGPAMTIECATAAAAA
jgi:3-methylfumaryl-CoA hydratase